MLRAGYLLSAGYLLNDVLTGSHPASKAIPRYRVHDPFRHSYTNCKTVPHDIALLNISPA
jgi:hypothetical protein